MVARAALYFFRAAFFLSVGLSAPLSFVAPPLYAAAPFDQSQLNTDVQALLTNDQALMDLKQKLGAKDITNVDYAQSLQSLNQARKEILAHYDRAGQHQLTTLYNAAKKDQAAQAAETARQAKEAAAQAAAQAKTQADLAANQAKAATALALTQTIQDDANAYTAIALQHDHIGFLKDMGRGSPSDLPELTRLEAAGKAIKDKYAAHGPLSASAVPFNKLLEDLSINKILPEKKQWETDIFPTPETLQSDFSDDTQRAAAMTFFEELLNRQKSPRPQATDEKISAYQNAVNKLGNYHYNQTVEDPDFQARIMIKYLPLYADSYVGAAEAAKKLAVQKAELSKIASGIILIALTILAFPLIYIFLTHRTPKTIAPTTSFDLPETLQNVKVLGKTYGVRVEFGCVYDKEVWTETHVSTTTSGGNSYTQGGVQYTTPQQTTTHVSSTVYHRYWIRTTSGKETWKRFSDDVFPASVGHIISTLDWDTDILMAYNHTTTTFSTGWSWLKAPHAFRIRYLWLTSIAIWFLGFMIMATVLHGSPFPQSSPYLKDLPIGGAIFTALFAGLYLLILKLVLQTIRTIQFKARYATAFQTFLQDRTPAVMEHFDNHPSLPVSRA